MKVTVTEARRTLPDLVKQVRAGDLRIQITVHGEVAAELRAATEEPPRGAAAAKLKQLMARLPAPDGVRRDTSEQVSRHLYGGRDE